MMWQLVLSYQDFKAKLSQSCKNLVLLGGLKRGKRGGVIRHILERETVIGLKKLRDCVNDQSRIQRKWVNLALT